MLEYDENENYTSSSDYDDIDNFLDNYSDDLYLLYEDIKSKSEPHSPFFLCIGRWKNFVCIRGNETWRSTQKFYC